MLEVVVDPPGVESPAETKMREDMEKSGQEIPLTREELWEVCIHLLLPRHHVSMLFLITFFMQSGVVSSLTTVIEAEEAPPTGVALWVTPVKQLSEDSQLIFRRTQPTK